MMLIGAGQGASLSPLTVAGIAGVEARDAGAAAGVVNFAHQIGGSLGLAILTVVFAGSGTATLVSHIAAALTGSTIMFALALALVAGFVLYQKK